MKITATAKVDCNHNRYSFKHKVKGREVTFDIVAFSEERALAKAWQYVKDLYKQHKTQTT